jgi:hypothetical protein
MGFIPGEKNDMMMIIWSEKIAGTEISSAGGKLCRLPLLIDVVDGNNRVLK